MKDLHELPKLSDSISYLYVEHCIIEQKAKAVEKIDKDGRTMIPAANLTVLMLGPGTSITHAAVKSLADNGCGIVWVGEDATRFYAHGSGETRRSYHLLHQARLASDPQTRLAVCKRMYRKRFDEELEPDLSIEQLRGKEGARVRTAYTQASIVYNVPWHGRRYNRNNWNDSDPINRALSSANALLYGVCHAAIVSGGYSPALGFVHTGKQRSFVFDIADLYKVELSIPVAFRVTGQSTNKLSARVREACREAFRECRLLKRILPDIADVLDLSDATLEAGAAADVDSARPEPLWTPAANVDSARPEPPRTPAADVDSACPEPLRTPADKSAAPTPHLTDERSEAENPALLIRRKRAKAGIEGSWEIHQAAPNTWQVITSSGPPGYTVHREEGQLHCSCPDFAKNELGACKHTIAVELMQERSHT